MKRYLKRNHKFGIEIPTIWNDCVHLDRDNSNTLWQDAAQKEMKNSTIFFNILNDEEAMLVY
jgi:hypothetical protein